MAKNIVLCLDGTGNEYGKHKTNVVHLFEAAARDGGQTTYYDPGIGTFSAIGLPFAQPVGMLLGKAFGLGLRQNLAEAYGYLMGHWEPGDRIFLFGFSRGAFTARALAGMLHKCGLLEKGNDNLLPYAVKIYNQKANGKIAKQFKASHGRECQPYFIGLWDTVASLGWFLGKKFFDTRLNRHVTYGYHAVAIDEKRRRFPTCLWDEKDKAPHQVIEQVWFPGAHSDVGGWYGERELSDITLEWMLGKAQAAGLRLKDDFQSVLNLNPWPRGALHESRVGFWRLWRPDIRQIPEGAKIHRSVLERPAYSPALPVDFEIVESTAPQSASIPDAETFDLAPFKHLMERGVTEIEHGPEHVWAEVREALLRSREPRGAELRAGEAPTLSFLDEIPPGGIRRLVSHGVIAQVPAGAMITLKGCGEREMFIVLDGQFEATDDGHPLNLMGRGELFGEISFFRQDGLRMASVHALTDGRLLVLRRRLMNDWIRENPTLAVPLVRQLGGLMAEHLDATGKHALPQDVPWASKRPLLREN